MIKIIGTGLTGLVGSRITELLSPSYTFENISRSTGVDIIDKKAVFAAIQNNEAEVILHLAAKADVDRCEEDKVLGEDGETWQINVVGVSNIVEACEAFGKKLIFISTDFVFDGQHPPSGGYTESDIPNPINWYAQTKYEGEKIVQTSRIHWTILRIAYPYRAMFSRNDFVRVVLGRLTKGEKVSGITDHVITPTLIDDIANALDILIKQNEIGIFHVVGSECITPFDAAMKIATIFEKETALVSETTREAYFKGKAPRPFQLPMRNDKIESLGVKMRGFSEGLEEIKRQLEG